MKRLGRGLPLEIDTTVGSAVGPLRSKEVAVGADVPMLEKMGTQTREFGWPSNVVSISFIDDAGVAAHS